ncbi:hypothetical protein [Sinorhizobium fredii]|uniref:hypothetical protein n=1 Tax=Rhizobium fredii TaxID=380 RepID=UPI0005654B10|nr:hypothetical protein [Sinorhizobium fredii]
MTLVYTVYDGWKDQPVTPEMVQTRRQQQKATIDAIQNWPNRAWTWRREQQFHCCQVATVTQNGTTEAEKTSASVVRLMALLCRRNRKVLLKCPAYPGVIHHSLKF